MERNLARAESGNRPWLTQEEYEVGRGLVETRATKLSDIGIDSGDILPWDRPDEFIPGVELKISGAGQLSTAVRTMSSPDLIDLVSNPRKYLRANSSAGNYYVRAWLELQHRIHEFEARSRAKDLVSTERELRAEERAKRAERHALIGTIVAVLSVLVAAISLAVQYYQ